VVARNPRIRMVRLDSLSTHLRIALPGFLLQRPACSGTGVSDSGLGLKEAR